MRRFSRALAFAAGFSLIAPGLTAAAAQSAVVPFVGCRSDGQLGPQPAPSGNKKPLALGPDKAKQLAYYQAKDGPGVLAPRGWHCFGTYGSNGSTIYVTPQPVSSKLLFSEAWKGFEGPAIELSDQSGGTSGRFAVAAMIARVFPAYASFATAVQKEHVQDVDLGSGPYPTDTLRYLNPHAVEYTTPAHASGVGTMSRLFANDQSINGVQILTGADTDLISLSIRLSAEDAALAAVIKRQAEREYTAPPPKP